MRAIDVDELHEIINWTSMKPPFSKKTVHRFIDMARTVEAEPIRHGKWKQWDDYGFEETYECTACGESVTMIDGESPISNGFKYCPYCGAKMNERKE